MPDQTSFAVLYKKLMNCNFDPSEERADLALTILLRELSKGPPKKQRFLLKKHTDCDKIPKHFIRENKTP